MDTRNSTKCEKKNNFFVSKESIYFNILCLLIEITNVQNVPETFLANNFQIISYYRCYNNKKGLWDTLYLYLNNYSGGVLQE